MCVTIKKLILFTFVLFVPEIWRNSGKRAKRKTNTHTCTHTYTKKNTFVFPDVYYQHGDDVPLSIQIQNNIKIPLRDKLI